MAWKKDPGKISIEGRAIGASCPPFIIAEMSGNHNQSLDRALDIVEAAAGAGADALKLQTYTADTITLDIDEGDFFIKDPGNLWKGNSLYKLYQQAYTPWEWHEPIFKRCRELGIIPFSTPFDETAVDFLEEIGAPAYKIASFENTHLPLIEKVAKTGKPLIVSTGMASIAELDETVTAARRADCRNIILLKCTSTYPAAPDSTNLRTIAHMRDLFDVQVGLSDHTLGMGVAIGAVAFGATVIEKHFTLLRADGGVDSAFSMEPDELALLVKEARHAWQALGQIHYGPVEKEKPSMRYRRSLYISQNIQAGEILTKDNLRAVRPGMGLPSKYYEIVLGKRINKSASKGTPLSWEIIG